MTITSTRTAKSRVIAETKRPSKFPSVIFPKGTANTSDTLTPPNSDPFPVVRVTEDRRVVATSKDVAAYFGKQHKHVMDAIKELSTIDPSLRPNFRPIEVDVEVGFGTRKFPAYEMDRKGFTMLAFGFTGEKAIKFKSRYIDAFDEAIERLALLEKAREVPVPSFPVPQTFAEALRLAADRLEEAEKLAEENEVLLIENQELRDELDFIPIQSFPGRRQIYPSARDMARLASWASRTARERGITLGSEPRTIHTSSGPKQVSVNVYPIELLDEGRSVLRICPNG